MGVDDLPMESTIGERIRRLRNDVVMTQDDLAAAAGVSTDLIRKLEQGRRHTASIGSLHRIAAALDVDLGELLGRMQHRMPEWSRSGILLVCRVMWRASRCRCGRLSDQSSICGVRTGAEGMTS